VGHQQDGTSIALPAEACNWGMSYGARVGGKGEGWSDPLLDPESHRIPLEEGGGEERKEEKGYVPHGRRLPQHEAS
jgi:hypothetical protein